MRTWWEVFTASESMEFDPLSALLHIYETYNRRISLYGEDRPEIYMTASEVWEKQRGAQK